MSQLLGIDKVFTPSLCRDLIAGFAAHGGEPTGFMRDEGDESIKVLDPGIKIREDWFLDEASPLVGRIDVAIRMQIAPKIRGMFYLERFMVARYGPGGHFKPHRDNTEKATARRWLACSINLNDDYSGGELHFPEAQQRARPPLGSALIFPCDMLHEAMPVERGERYVFPTFLLRLQ